MEKGTTEIGSSFSLKERNLCIVENVEMNFRKILHFA